MDITPYVEGLRRELAATADTGSAETRAAADRLLLSLEPSARLALMEAVSHAAAEITADLPAGSVDVRLRGRDLDLVVDVPAPPATAVVPPTPPTPPAPEEPDGDLARITLRIPEQVKTRAEERAADAGQSLNTWLVHVIRAATRDRAISVDIDLSSLPFGPGSNGRDARPGRRMTGWL